MLNESDTVSLPDTRALFTARSGECAPSAAPAGPPGHRHASGRSRGVARATLPLVALLAIGGMLMPRSSHGAPPDLAATGILDIDSIPSSLVLVDGRPLGATPRIRESVSSGTHVVVFVYSPEVSCRQSIQVSPGATTTVMDRLGVPPTPGRRCRGEVTSPR
jgi:hypothetical protein